MKYPKYVKYEGKKYPINTDFRVGLKCLSIVEDDSIGDTERAYAVIYLLFGFIPDTSEGVEYFLRKCETYLSCGVEQEEQSARPRDIDLEQDYRYISSSFRSDYDIDLETVTLHFWQFIDLIQGFTSRSLMSRIREIRNYDLGEIKDPKQRTKILRAKESVKLKEKLNEETLEAIEQFEKLFE